MEEEEVFPTVDSAGISASGEVTAPLNLPDPSKKEEAGDIVNETAKEKQNGKRKLADKEAPKKVCFYYQSFIQTFNILLHCVFVMLLVIFLGTQSAS